MDNLDKLIKSKEIKFDFTGKTVIITGASSGIGRDAAYHFAEAGANVAVLARRYDRLKALADEINGNGGSALAIKCDVRHEEETLAAVKAVAEKFGTVDILYNNAGISRRDTPEMDVKDGWQDTIDTNLTGSWLMIRACLPYMLKQGRGKIINTASVYALRPIIDTPIHPYFSSKAGVIGLTKGVATCYGKKGITCNCICPGSFKTEITEVYYKDPKYVDFVSSKTPVGRVGRRGECAGIVQFLASDWSDFITAQVIAVDGGCTETLS